MRRQLLIKILGYVAFSLVALLASFYLTFPAEALGQRLAHEVTRATRGLWSVSFGDISLYRLSGFAAEQVKLRKNTASPVELQLDAVQARLRLLPLLLLRTSVDASVRLGEGELSARLTPGSGRLSAELDLQDVDFASPPVLSQLVGVPMGGKVVGDARTEWEADPRKSAGNAKVTIENMTLGPGTVAGFTIPSIQLGTIELGLALEDGKLRIASYTQKGGNITTRVSGTATMRPQLETSGLDACLEFRADPAFLNDNPKLKTALQLAEVQLKKDPNGFLHVPLSGTLASPRLRGGLCRGG